MRTSFANGTLILRKDQFQDERVTYTLLTI